jgi:hypothetical protein
MTDVGPLSLGEHVFWFLLVSLFVFLVYNALRVDSVRDAALRGVKRWLVFLAGSAALAVVTGLLALTLGYSF